MVKMLGLLIICVFTAIAESGVKIEISRVKDPPKPTTFTLDDENVTIAADKFTTLATPATTTTAVIATNATDSVENTNFTVNFGLEAANTTSIPVPIAKNTTNLAENITNTIVNMMIIPNTSTNDLFQLSELTRRQLRRKLIPQNYYCPCDLKINFCDINCCCDIDCASKEIMQTLKCDEREWSIYDYEDVSKLQLCSQSSRFSLFCLVDHSRRRKSYEKRNFKIQELDVMNVVRYKWPNQFDRSAVNLNDYREHYTFGDSILAWDDSNEAINFLSIPRSFVTDNCHISTPIKHLINDESKCVQTLDEHDKFVTEFETKLKSIKILTYRKPLSASPAIMSDFCKSPQNSNETENCINIMIYHCVHLISMKSCSSDANSTLTDYPDNVLTNDLFIQFHHNFTNILNCSVFFVYHDFADTTGYLVQTIRIEYLELNETYLTKDVHQVSGNIGYLQHKPLIVTKYLQHNGSLTDEKQTERLLAYFHNETICSNNEHYLKVPLIQSNGDCLLNNNSFNRIDFGENIRIKCIALLTPMGIGDNSSVHTASMTPDLSQNYTNTCRFFQKTVFNYLLHRFELENPNATVLNHFNVRISEMGNPKNKSTLWIEFKVANAPNMEDIAAGPSSSETEFTCMNMILSIRYEFFYGRMLMGSVPNQALIKAAKIEFGNRVDLNFKLDEDVFKVPIYLDVMFYDFGRAVENSSTTVANDLLALLVMNSIGFLAYIMNVG